MGLYISKTQRINGVSKWDAYGQYLNYHEGWTGYRNRSYAHKAWLKRVARKVQVRAERFGAQYRSCERELAEEIGRSEEHTSELQSLMRISYAVFCLKKKKKNTN